MVGEEPLIILAGNGPYENRGCEAIVRGTVKILREYFRDPRFICTSFFNSEEQFREQCRQETDPAITHLRVRGLSKSGVVRNFWKPGLWEAVCRNYFDGRSPASWTFKDMLQYLDEAAAVLSVGGDNYSLDYGVPTQFTDLDDLVLSRDRPLAIWGASIGPFSRVPDYERFMRGHLRSITGIFARESATIGYLEKLGVTQNVYHVADPAFLMDPVKPAGIGDDLAIEKDAIGLNLSPLMAKFVTDGDQEAWIKIASSIIAGISETTERPLYLIPHVTMRTSNDWVFLQEAVSLIHDKKSSITVIPPTHTAAETKWIISNMGIFAGARTHATIAALSSGVPTLSFAYSIKAQGINQDIFGHTRYCLDPTDLRSETVSRRIAFMMDNRVQIEKEVRDRIPEVQRKALHAGVGLAQIIDGKD